MKRGVWLAAAIGAAVASSFGGAARAQDAGAPTLASTDFTLTVSREDASGNATVLSTDELATYFSLARCACPTNVVVGLAISSDAAANLGTHAVDAQIMVGNDCDIAMATGCTSLGGTLTLSPTKLGTTQSLGTAAVFSAASDAGCAATTTSTRLWAIVRLDGARLASEPSLALTLGGAGPTAPTAVTTQTAEQGLLVSWTASGDATTLQGHQVLCSPGPTTAATASYDTCAAATPDGGAGPFATLEPQFLCSGLVAVGTNSVRVHGLTNGQVYEVAVVAVGVDGTPSAASVAATGTPGPTFGLSDLYKEDGGTAQPGCALGGAGASVSGVGLGAALAVVLAVVLARRRRRRGSMLVALLVAGLAGARTARAESDGPPFSLAAPGFDAPETPSPRRWNLELRFGPYRPNIDDEFADRGSDARPFEQLFSSSRHLMMQLEVDRQLLHRAGTWGLGFSVGYYHATAAALEADLSTPSGDETGLRLVPLSAALVYRADQLRTRFKSLVVPYAKLGLDCTFWRMTDTSQADVDGHTFGWHAAAGVTLDLSFLDPEAAHSMDHESGINQTAAFVEVARYSLDDFGSGSALHVGDTTWFAGLMLEL
jgi:hypothetical protein